MSEVPLARLWRLPDGTCCLLLKDPHADNWVLRVVRGSDTMRSESFASAVVAMDEARAWRASYDHSVEMSS